ncbi:MAG TPA: AAA family ATPase [Allocoleopsis sp.]
MSFNFNKEGIPICKILSENKDRKDKIIYFDESTKSEENIFNQKFDELKLKNSDDKYQLVPSDKVRSIYVSGQQGIGKSYWIGHYLKEYQRKHPDAKIIIFSEKGHDKNIDDKIKNITRVPCDKSLLDNPVDKEELSSQDPYTMFVFDDVDALETRIRKEVYRVLNAIINVYRDKKLNIIFSSHESCDGKYTKTALNGCDCFVFFHRNYNRSVEYFVKEYVKKKEVKNFEDGKYNDSRWCVFIKTYPSILLFENYIKIA